MDLNDGHDEKGTHLSSWLTTRLCSAMEMESGAATAGCSWSALDDVCDGGVVILNVQCMFQREAR